VIEGIKGKLGNEVLSGRKVLVYFYTNSCAACKPMTPVIDRLKKEYKNIHKINLATDMDTGRAFGVMGTPATILVEDQKIKSFNLGAKTESFLRNLIQ
jgi:thioredoxin 1